MVKVAEGEHAVVTGGSSGIGLECARELLRAGATVTLVARNRQKLKEAAETLREGTENRVITKQADVGKPDRIEAAVREAEEEAGKPVGILICSAGMAECKTFEDTGVEDFDRLISVNYFGTVNTVRSCLPSMRRRGAGRIVLVSSQAGQVGLYGYTSYSASKFALSGFAQALEMECRDDGISVGVCYPPDTDTPQFEYENRCKPAITKAMVGKVTPASASQVARVLLRGMVTKKFSIVIGFDGWALGIATGVMNPPNSFLSVLVDLFMLPIIRLVSLVTLLGWHQTIRRHKNAAKKSE
uniref:3-dehydrosphinganine reductase n=1 Tax=Chloropicon primus TaxID=1764295 RepID=A0A7S2WXF1_9CHLO